MKYIFTILILSTFAFANYSIYYGNFKIGDIKNFDTLKDNYIKIKITNSLAKFLIGKKELIYYNDKSTIIRNNKNIKYKKDKYQVINIIKQSISQRLKEGKIVLNKNKYIDIKLKEDYQFEYVSKGKVKSNGIIKIEDKEFIALIDKKNSVKIIKN